jgi:hypothetical protein
VTSPQGLEPQSEKPGRDWAAKPERFRYEVIPDAPRHWITRRGNQARKTVVYNLTMTAEPKGRPKGPWTQEESDRNERVAKIRVQHDRARGVSANLEDVVVLTRFANRFAEAFKDTRRA